MFYTNGLRGMACVSEWHARYVETTLHSRLSNDKTTINYRAFNYFLQASTQQTIQGYYQIKDKWWYMSHSFNVNVILATCFDLIIRSSSGICMNLIQIIKNWW
jgi:hypothetical protein